MKKFIDVSNSQIYNERKWEQFYQTTKKDELVYPSGSAFDYLLLNNRDNYDAYAINYMGTRLTYSQLFDKIDECLIALVKHGVKRGDVVSVCMPTTPESVIAYYAINKLGAVSNFIDPRESDETIVSFINEGKSKLLLVLDSFLGKLLSKLELTSLDKVVCVSPFESFSSLKKRAVQFLTKSNVIIPNDSGYSDWNNFIKTAENSMLPNLEKNSDNQLAILIHTSGSTAKSKTVELSNLAVNKNPYQYMHNGMNYAAGDVYLDIIPMFLAFGAILGVHLPLCLNMENVIIPAYDRTKLASYLKKYSPQHVCLTPAYYEDLLSSPLSLDLSKVKTFASGGDGMSANQDFRYANYLREHGYQGPMQPGFGSTENGVSVSASTPSAYKYGSNGIPLPGNNVVIVDPNTYEPLGYNQPGLVVWVNVAPMSGYYNNPELTETAMVSLSDGSCGIVQGDCGYVDSDGFFFSLGRYGDEIKLSDGTDIWPIEIENVAYRLPFVKSCVATKDEHENVCVYVVLHNDKKLSIEQQLQIVKSDLQLYVSKLDINVYCVDELPLTKNGKVDRIYAKKLTNK